MKQVTVDLPDEIYIRLKQMGVEEGIDITTMLGMFIHTCLGIYEDTRSKE